MLYKNDEVYHLTNQDKKKVYDFLGWENKAGSLTAGKKVRPAVITHPESVFTFDKVNNRMQKPTAFNLPLEAVTYGEDGSEKWNYTQRPPRVDTNTKQKMFESHMPMRGTFTLDENRVDFLYFLLFLSPFREYSEQEVHSEKKVQKTKPFFKVENKEAEAKAKNERARRKVIIQNYINGDPSVAWDIAKIRKHAIVFDVANASEMGPEEVKSALLGKLEGEPNAWNNFWEQINLGDELEIRYMIKKAVEEKKIKYFDKDRKWFLINEEGKKQEAICSHTNLSQKPENDLLAHIQADEPTAQMFRLL